MLIFVQADPEAGWEARQGLEHNELTHRLSMSYQWNTDIDRQNLFGSSTRPTEKKHSGLLLQNSMESCRVVR